MLGAFATDPLEALYPELWDGCIFAICPSVTGPTGSHITAFGSSARHMTFGNCTPDTDWIVSGGQSALSFSGTNEYLTTTGVQSLTGHLSATFWIKTTHSGGSCVVVGQAIGGSTCCMGLTFGYAGATGRCQLWNDASAVERVNQSTAVNTGVWTHVGVRRTGSAGNWLVEWFLNGQPDGSGTSTRNPSPGDHLTTVSAFGNWKAGGAYLLTADLDDLRLYDRGLSNEQFVRLASARGIAFTQRPRRIIRAATVPAYRRRGHYHQTIGSGIY